MRRQWLLLGAAGVLALLCRAGSTAVPAEGGAEIPAPKYAALTFDDGPRRGTTDRLLDGLKERGASATFFLIGQQVEANRDLVERMRAEGHQIGNHTWSHQRLEGMGEDLIGQEIGRTEAVLEEVLRETGPYWLRPPYGLVTAGAEDLVSVPMVKWSVDPRDWESRNQAQVTAAILEHVEPGCIILLHDIYPSSVDAALEVVDRLEAEGYWFVTVEELLRLNGITPQPGAMYRTGSG